MESESLKKELRTMRYVIASLAEQDLRFHGKRDEWYRMVLYIPGLGRILHIPQTIAEDQFLEVVKKYRDGIRRIETSAMAKDWAMIDVRISELTKAID